MIPSGKKETAKERKSARFCRCVITTSGHRARPSRVTRAVFQKYRIKYESARKQSRPSIILLDDPRISYFIRDTYRSNGLFSVVSIFHDAFDGEGTVPRQRCLCEEGVVGDRSLWILLVIGGNLISDGSTGVGNA